MAGSKSTSHPSKIIPAQDMIKVTPGASEFTEGPCRALWIGEAGTINITPQSGIDRDAVPAQVGLLPVSCTKVRAGGTATDIWAIY